MKALTLAAAFALTAPFTARGQVVPTTPTKFGTRSLGNATNSGSVGVAPVKRQISNRTVTHIVLGEPRQWKLADGKFFLGKLIAFEDLVVERQNGAAPAATPAVPAKPTTVRNGSARFLVNAKPYELAMERLGPEERKFIEDTRLAIAAKK